jgi:hypothetical protein
MRRGRSRSRGCYHSSSPRERSKEGGKNWGADGYGGKHYPHSQQQHNRDVGHEGGQQQQQHWEQRGSGYYRGARGRGYGRYGGRGMVGGRGYNNRDGAHQTYDRDAEGRRTSGQWNADGTTPDHNRPASRYDLSVDNRGAAAGGHRPVYLNSRVAPNAAHPGGHQGGHQGYIINSRGRGRGRYSTPGMYDRDYRQHR